MLLTKTQMKTYFLQAISLFTILIFVSNCKGQTTNGLSNTKTSVKLEPKLKKNYFTNQYQEAADNIHNILQDKAGNLWLCATGDGIYRFDGKTFINFTTKDGLSSNEVWSILEDKLGNIWIGTDNGLCKYDGKTISKISFTTAKTATSKNAVWSMMQDKSGLIWFGTTEDLYCYDGKVFSRFLDNNNILNNQKLQLKWVQSMHQDSKGTIWIGSGPIADEGVIAFDGKSIKSSKPNGDGWIRYIIEDKSGKIWFSGRNNGVFFYDGKSFQNFTEKKNIGGSILADRAGNIWFDGGEKLNSNESDGGIWCYNGKTFKNYVMPFSLGNYSVWSIFEDKEGNIWIGTRNTGLYKFDGKSFSAYTEQKTR